MILVDHIEPKKLGERLRIARANRDVSQEAAARGIGMSRTTIIAIEQGERRVRAEELRAFAKLYAVSMSDLVREPAVHVDLNAQFRRTGADMDAGGDEAARLLNRLATAAVEIEARLGRRREFNLPPERPIQNGPLEDQAEDLAVELRQRLGLGLAPLADLVAQLEQEFDIRLFFRPLHSKVSGVFAYDPAVGPCMLINSSHTPERQLQTIAHELGHFMARRRDAHVVLSDRKAASREERFVTLFGLSLLMPAAAVRKKFHELTGDGKVAPRHILLLAHWFGVSFEAMTRRLEALGLLPAGTADVIKQRGFQVAKAKEALGLPASRPILATPPRLLLLAVEAYRRELLSEGQLADMLVVDRVQLREQLDALGGDDPNDEIAVPT